MKTRLDGIVLVASFLFSAGPAGAGEKAGDEIWRVTDAPPAKSPCVNLCGSEIFVGGASLGMGRVNEAGGAADRWWRWSGVFHDAATGKPVRSMKSFTLPFESPGGMAWDDRLFFAAGALPKGTPVLGVHGGAEQVVCLPIVPLEGNPSVWRENCVWKQELPGGEKTLGLSLGKGCLAAATMVMGDFTKMMQAGGGGISSRVHGFDSQNGQVLWSLDFPDATLVGVAAAPEGRFLAYGVDFKGHGWMALLDGKGAVAWQGAVEKSRTILHAEASAQGKGFRLVGQSDGELQPDGELQSDGKFWEGSFLPGPAGKEGQVTSRRAFSPAFAYDGKLGPPEKRSVKFTTRGCLIAFAGEWLGLFRNCDADVPAK